MCWEKSFRRGESTGFLTKKQLDVLNKIAKELEALPDDEDKFYDYCSKKYKDDVPNFKPKSYGF